MKQLQMATARNLILGNRHHLLWFGPPRNGTHKKIKTLASLRSHLQTAVELEHSTIPPYLTAMYSIKPGANEASVAIIRSVVMEEMLHMILACNILNAVGGKPSINHKKFVPEYPTYLPHSNKAFKVNLEKFSKPTMRTFLKIEQPAKRASKPEANHYATIGQFYDAIKEGLEYLSQKGDIFTGDPARQITAKEYYGGGGQIVEVYGLADAIKAIDEIVGQGEGINGTIEDGDHKIFGEEIEYAHYFRFNEIYKERYYKKTDTPKSGPTGKKLPVDWNAVQPIKTNIKMSHFKKGSEEWNMMYGFNKTYRSLLDALHNTVNGQPGDIQKAVGVMYQLKYQALQLMNLPIGRGLFAAPSFEFVT
jgi:hypothetical protein